MYVKELNIGDPKGGKTWAVINSYPRPLLDFNFDPAGYSGLSAVTKVWSPQEFKDGFKKQEKWDGVHVIDFATSTPVRIGGGKFSSKETNTGILLFDCFNLLVENNPFKTVMLDSFSFLDRTIIQYIRAINSKDQLEIQHWYQVGDKKEEIVNCFLSLNCHVVITAHIETIKDDITGIVESLPYGTGKFQKKLSAMFSAVIWRRGERGGDGQVKYVAENKPNTKLSFLGIRTERKLPAITGPLWDDIYKGEIGL
jgi:hypothetical protein